MEILILVLVILTLVGGRVFRTKIDQKYRKLITIAGALVLLSIVWFSGDIKENIYPTIIISVLVVDSIYNEFFRKPRAKQNYPA